MCTFAFTYTDGQSLEFTHIKSTRYFSSDDIAVSEEHLATHEFPLDRNLWLFSESGSFCVSSENLRCLEVITE